MSVADMNVNTVVAYTSGVTKPFSGQRLASFNWKTGTNKDSLWFGIKRESKAVSLPQIAAADIAANITALTPHIRVWLHGVQDKMIREMLDVSDTVLHVTNESIGIAAMCEFLEESNESGRVTKADVEVWFKENIADSLMVSLAERLGVSDTPSQADSDKIDAVVAAFKGKISALAGGKTSYDPKTAAQLQKCLSLVPAGDVLADRFTLRLQKMVEVKEDDLLNAL
jgi:hypothetical protein